MTAATPYNLGFFASNPNGNDPIANAQFEQEYNEFTQLMGARPGYMDGFVDYSLDPSQWAANASWTAWSWAMTGNNYVGPGSGIIPVIGVAMASTSGTNGSWDSVDAFYRQIIAGTYDSDYAGIVKAWAAQGYTKMELRIGYEFNGNFMPWAPGNSSSSTVNADFIAAWQHIASIVHTAGQADGITVQTVWNPNEMGYDPTDPRALYPGNQYVDIIATDVYSPTYPNDLTNYTSTGSENGQSPDATTWAESITNREHWWEYPDANQWNPTGTGGGWSLADTIAFAKQEGKPLAVAETGAGGDGATLGPNDDPAFAQWLAGELKQAQAQGVTIQNVDIWATDQSDGDWGFLGGEKPQEAASWAANFGASGATPASQFDTVGSNDTSIAAPHAVTASQGASTKIAGLSISDPWAASQPGNVTLIIVAGNGKLSMTDGSGNPVTSSGTAMITVTDTLANINADLTTLSYQSGGGADIISIAVVNQAGNADEQTISINQGTGAPATIDTGSSKTVTTGASAPTFTSSDLNMIAPATESDASGIQESFTGVSISDPWAATQPGNFTVTVQAGAGVLSMTDSSGNLLSGSGTSTITLKGSLLSINTDLTTLTYQSNSGAADVVSITATNQAAVSTEQYISVNHGGSPIIPAVTIGNGPDMLSFSISQLAYLGSSQFTFWIDGTQIGGMQTVNAAALYAAQLSQTYNLSGTFDAGAHTATVDFLNPASGGSAQTTRTLYVSGASFEGIAIAGSTLTQTAAGDQSFTFQGNGSIPVVVVGQGPDTLALSVSQDGWGGNAQFTVSVDGKQIGGTQTVDAGAAHGAGLSQIFDVAGSFASGTHKVTIDFLNEAYGGTTQTDRALYVTGASLNGVPISDGSLIELGNGPQSFSFQVYSMVTFLDSNGVKLTQAVIPTGSLDIYSSESGLNNNVHQWVDSSGVHNLSTDAWGYVTNVRINENAGASYATSSFVETDATLSGATTAAGKAATFTVESAERGTITLGTGNYSVAFTAANAWGPAADNTVNLTMGSGNDTFSLTGSYSTTNGVVHAGSGVDRMTFLGTDTVRVFGGSGTATASVAGGAGSDTFTAGTGVLNVTDAGSKDVFLFHAGDGLLSLSDFSTARGDSLQIDSSLLSSMHETAESGGLMITFGTNTTDGIMLDGLSALAASAIRGV